MHPGMYEKYFQPIGLQFQCCQPLCWKSISQVALSETGPVVWILDMILLSQKGLIMKNFSCSLFKQITGWPKKSAKLCHHTPGCCSTQVAIKWGRVIMVFHLHDVYVLCQLYRFLFTWAPGIFFSCAGTLQQHHFDCTCCTNIRERIPNKWG